MKKVLRFKRYLFYLLFALFFILVISLLNLIFDFNGFSKLISLLLVSIFTFASGFIKGKNTLCKAYKVGIINGLKIVVFFIILGLIIGCKLTIKSFIYYLIIVFTSILGSVLGKNKKKN